MDENNAGYVVSQKRPTISDVAKIAHVSVGTVSNVLNNPDAVRPETRQAVVEAMEALSYRPNMSARSMSAVYRKRRADTRTPRLVVAGYINVDYTAFVDVIPHREDRLTASRIRKSLGGPAANVAVAAAALRNDLPLHVELASALGSDADSEWALLELSRLGVQVAHMRTPPRDRLSRCLIFVEPNGSRTIVNEPLHLTTDDVAFPIFPTQSDTTQCLHVEGYQAQSLADVMTQFRAAGWRVSLHTAGLPQALRTPDGLAHLCRCTDVLFLNRQLAQALFPAIHLTETLVAEFAQMLRDVFHDRGHVVVTLDESGCAVFARDSVEPFRIAAPRVGMVDSTGAGDALAGAFLSHWLNGHDLQTSARAGVAAGSLSVTAQGAQGAPADAKTLDDFMARIGLAVRSDADATLSAGPESS